MALRLNGSSSGYVELEVPADAGSHTLTLPDGGGTSGQYLQTNGSGTLSWQTVASLSNAEDGTGTHTYTVRFGGNGSQTIFINRTGRDGTSDPLCASSITLMEVAV